MLRNFSFGLAVVALGLGIVTASARDDGDQWKVSHSSNSLTPANRTFGEGFSALKNAGGQSLKGDSSPDKLGMSATEKVTGLINLQGASLNAPARSAAILDPVGQQKSVVPLGMTTANPRGLAALKTGNAGGGAIQSLHGPSSGGPSQMSNNLFNPPSK